MSVKISLLKSALQTWLVVVLVTYMHG